MIFRRRSENAPAEGPPLSRVPCGAELRGTLCAAADLAIDGRVVGDVEVRGEVTIGAAAEVEGTVHARFVRVAGKVTGPVVAEERVEILPGGSVSGDLTSPHVVVSDGADLHGKVDVLH
jgi:cytoskeletal protein CcmA (bactofilin family)